MPNSILIVAAERGLGLGLAGQFFQRGWRVTGTARAGADTSDLEAVLRQIQALYAIEAGINGKPIEQRLAIRQDDPEAYLATVLDRMAHGHLNTRLEDLLPWNIQPRLAAAA